MLRELNTPVGELLPGDGLLVVEGVVLDEVDDGLVTHRLSNILSGYSLYLPPNEKYHQQNQSGSVSLPLNHVPLTVTDLMSKKQANQGNSTDSQWDSGSEFSTKFYSASLPP